MPGPAEYRARLRADCARCVGLCCVAPAFTRSADFALDKPAGEPCPNLRADFACSIHDSLRERGFAGCAVFDCFGAGQHVVQVTFAGSDWRTGPETAGRMFAVFGVLRDLHELLWYLNEALALEAARPVHAELRRMFAETERLTGLGAGALARLEVDAHRAEANVALRRASELARAGTRGPELRGADLLGEDFHGAGLRGACLRGARLLGADLTGADLDRADLTGADLRGADLSRAALADALFLTQPQLDSARGDGATTLPPWLTRPAHWTAHPARSGRRPRPGGR
ncbi:uncharacterized protein YjbI with pentapeptide repeats [Prauserella shujinwangii]|uniref:Uncharacterized protein YjbI with pentapeptide repeats n=1 Tax=Prauserella shujinwangii TaxID=1453103 RepID=A0A2T0LRI3_9PSEU|nr:pentapeptide repeat-containing protein [Prauserella shujinwangii]PRX46111.1 uncharacterized protein YjbI with pentapeptide repeats [Prauserella shujinwangii]